MKHANTDKELKNKRIFEKNLKKILLNCFPKESFQREKIRDTINDFEAFDPLLDWKFAPVCGCEISGFDGHNGLIRQNRLFEKNGHRLSCGYLYQSSKVNTVTEGYEMWLLEDMSIVFTY